MNLLLDASLPPRLARALHQLASPEFHVEHVRDVLGNDASDQHVADYLAQHEGTAVVGIDLDITSTPHRLDGLRAGGRPVLLLHEDWLMLNAWDQSWQLAALFPAIIRKLAKTQGSATFLVPRLNAGRIRKVA